MMHNSKNVVIIMKRAIAKWVEERDPSYK